LNARQHTEESQIIAGAGAFGAVTIATNMAGRGVDIKLGGDLPEELIDSVNRVLRRSGFDNPYDMRMEERQQKLLALTPEQFGIYEAGVHRFLQHMEDMRQVNALGGLHVIGSERHEARRIDNQLRGRAARQGDPGSSRFYLSLEDELMARFGGEQANNLMQRFQVDDAMPMEVGLVGRLVEQSQTRVEGANFDVRKHLLEYDDVVNSQRQRIYAQRDLIFTKDDLSEDVTEMLRTEVQRRIPEALKDKDGPWKLIAWLDQIQPPISVGGILFPSYSLKLLLQHLESQKAGFSNLADVQDALLGLVSDALKTEDEHLLHVVDGLLESTQQRLEEQLEERRQALDTFFEGLDIGEGDESTPRNPREILDELSGVVHVPLKLSPEEQRLLRDDPHSLEDSLRAQVESAVTNQALVRLLGAVERRLEEPLDLNIAQLPSNWDKLAEQVFAALETVQARRRERLLGSNGHAADGAIPRDLETAINRVQGPLTSNHLTGLLMTLPQGSRATFDKKTHRRVFQRTTRLTYTYLAAHLLEGRDSQEIADEVLQHLEAAQAMLRRTHGANEFARLAGYRLDELDQTAQSALCAVLGEEVCKQMQGQPLQALDRDETIKVMDELGRMALTTIYRRLLLIVITELWVDYLTQMEALRVSIGLEAYAQRDPLVQYKSKASELFQTLLGNMRLGVVSRMFTFRPANMSSVQAESRKLASDEGSDELAAEAETVETGEFEVQEGEEETEGVESAETSTLSRSQKRRRRRR
jgi:preprotein translocase subunit SecA